MDITRESIFTNAVRSLCTSFATILGIVIGLAVAATIFMTIAAPSYLPEGPDPLIMPDAHGERAVLPGNTPAILRIEVQGVVGVDDLTGPVFHDILAHSRKGILQGDRVKGILLHVDTPGGTVVDADAIYRALLAYKEKFKVPVYAFVNGLCASGGMYIVSAADKIYATYPSVIGSIGVIMGPTFNFADAMAKYGVAALTITEGKDKDALNPFRPWKPGEDASIRDITARMYEQFVNIVTNARPKLDKTKLIQDYGAHVFIAKEAQTLGYIDVADTNYGDALTDLVAAAGIGEKEKYQVIQLVPPKPLLPSYFQGKFPLGGNGKITHAFDFSPYHKSELTGKLLYLYNP